MTVAIVHKFVNPKGDPADATIVRPSNWNDTHTMTMATGVLLGRSTAATGAVEEITPAARLALSAGTIDINMTATSRLLGRSTAGAGVAEEITIGTGLALAAGALSTTAPALPRGYIDGCVLVPNAGSPTTSVDIATGICRDSTNAVNITCAAMTAKDLTATWVAGSGAGIRATGAIANGTYHVYAVSTAAGVQDYYAHPSAVIATVIAALQAESGGASYVYARMIMSLVRISGAIIPFLQLNDEVLFTTVPAVNGSNIGIVPSNFLTNVPSGIKVVGIFNTSIDHASLATALYLYSPDVADQAVADSVAPLGTVRRWSGGLGLAGNQRIRTNTSTQIRAVTDCAPGTAVVKIATLGFVHPRGKDA